MKEPSQVSEDVEPVQAELKGRRAEKALLRSTYIWLVPEDGKPNRHERRKAVKTKAIGEGKI